MSKYVATVRWMRKPDEPFVGGRYSRAHRWSFDGGAQVPASASPSVVRVPFSDPAGVDPEEALLASVSSCHMLFFLDFANRAKFLVESYEDAVEGVMDAGADGRTRMTHITLRPLIRFGGEQRPSEAELAELHHKAHDACFIANTVTSKIRIENRDG